MASIIVLRTGQPGAGKSYSAVYWLVMDYLLHGKGLYITNLPLNRELIADYMHSRTKKPREIYLDRMIVIPDEELKAWRDLELLDKSELALIKDDYGFRPHEYLSQYELKGAHVAIDEFHRYFGKTNPPLLKKIWNDWFAEIRKLGCTFEAITQDASQLPTEFRGKVGKFIDVAPLGEERVPFIGIPLEDCFQLYGGLSGKIAPIVKEVESIKTTSWNGRQNVKKNRSRAFMLSQDIFALYNSFQKSDNSDQQGEYNCPAKEYGKRVWIWFLKKNWYPVSRVIFLVVFFGWIVFFGGGVFIFHLLLDAVMSTMSTNSPKSEQVQNLPSKRNNMRRSAMMSLDSSYSLDSAIIVPAFRYYDEYRPVLFWEGQVYLKNGGKVYENYKFQDGVYRGKTVTAINKEERSYTLDSQYILYMF